MYKKSYYVQSKASKKEDSEGQDKDEIKNIFECLLVLSWHSIHWRQHSP